MFDSIMTCDKSYWHRNMKSVMKKNDTDDISLVTY